MEEKNLNARILDLAERDLSMPQSEIARRCGCTRQHVSALIQQVPGLAALRADAPGHLKRCENEACKVTFRKRNRHHRFCSIECRREDQRTGPNQRATYRSMAYHLRAAGLKWTDVAAQVGYSSAIVAINEGRAYAQTHDLPWPLRRPAESEER